MKSLFKTQVLLIASLVSVSAFNPARAAEPKPPRPDLTGTVRTKEGAPLKDASVFIYTAGPRVGPGFL